MLAGLVFAVGGLPAFFAQSPQTTAETDDNLWPDATQCAVSLSYDDSVPVHHREVAPLLEKHGLRGTFYLSALTIENPEAWKIVAAAGHELGNHSLFHPCRRIDFRELVTRILRSRGLHVRPIPR